MVKTELTAKERYVVSIILEEARRCMEYDAEAQDYKDDSSFIMRLEKGEMAALTRAIKKI